MGLYINRRIKTGFSSKNKQSGGIAGELDIRNRWYEKPDRIKKSITVSC
jgi:hypothetical protein